MESDSAQQRGPLQPRSCEAEGRAPSNDELVRSLGSAVVGEVARARGEVAKVVQGAIDMSGNEIGAATKSILPIIEEAREHIQDLNSVIEKLHEHWESTVAMLAHYDDFGAEAVVSLRTQSDAADRSMELTGEIGGMVKTIARISVAVRILTINGQIESTRMGETGKAFAAISQQLSELNTEVRAASTAIADLAGRLTEAIPVIAETSRELLVKTERFHTKHRIQVTEFKAQCDRSQDYLVNAITQTRNRAQRILASANSILQRVQFHDRMSQELRDIEAIMKQSEDILTLFFNQLTDVAARPLDLGAALSEARFATKRMATRLGQTLDPSRPSLPPVKEGEIVML